jgi:hypothetical protein
MADPFTDLPDLAVKETETGFFGTPSTCASAARRSRCSGSPLRFGGTSVHGRGPVDPTVDVACDVVFTEDANGGHQQSLRISDDTGPSAGWVKVGHCQQTASD